MNIPYIINADSCTVFLNGRPRTVSRGQPSFLNLKKALMDGKHHLVEDLLDVKKQIKTFGSGLLEVVNGQVLYRGATLHGVVSSTLLKLISESQAGGPMMKFLENLLQNPDSNSVLQSYDFYSANGLTIDQDGMVLSWKGVGPTYWSIMGNTSTVVLQGEVDKGGHILNKVGSTIEVERFSVDSDRSKTCSFGVHNGAKEYADGWGEKTLLCRHNPKDVVAVPQDCGCQKLRLCKYEILCEVERGGDVTPKNGYSSDISTRLTFDQLRSEIRDICKDRGLDVSNQLDQRDIPDWLSSSDFASTDYWKAIYSLEEEAESTTTKAPSKAPSDVKEKVIACIERYLSKDICPTLRQVHSNLKIKGLTCEKILEIGRSEGFSL